MYKYLQITALVVALLAPSIYFVGYAYDWGYLDSFGIEHPMFFKAPQEYIGIAYVVIITFVLKLAGAVPEGLITLVFLAITIFFVLAFAIRYGAHRSKLWPKLYLRWSNWSGFKRVLVTPRFIYSFVAPAYLGSAFPVIITAGFAYLLLLLVSPGLLGYTRGQEAAKKLRDEWRPAICLPKNMMVGCTQILEAGKVVAAGKLIVASDSHAAIYDGNSVQIYSLRNRDIKTVLSK